MRARFVIAAGLLLTLHAMPAYPERHTETVLVESGPGHVRIYPVETGELSASISVPPNQKARVEFIWTDPAGETAGRTVKIAFPSKSATPTSDTIDISGYPEDRKPGLWRVDAIINGNKLSASYFLTKNRQLLAVSGNDKGGKLDALGHLADDSPDLSQTLEAALSDPDGDVRLSAVKAAGRLKSVIGKEYLKNAQHDPLPGIRAEAFTGLYSGKAGYPVAAAETAVSDASAEVRMAAARSIRVIGAKEADLMKALLKDPSPDVVYATINSLKAQGNEAATGVLLDASVTGGKSLRQNALGFLYSKEGKVSLKAIKIGLGDPDLEIRKKAFEAAINSKDADTALIRPLVNDTDSGVAMAAIDALYSRGDIEGLLAGLRSTYRDVRLRSTAYIGKTSGQKAVKGLESALKDDDKDVRMSAVAGLRQSGESGIKGLGEAVTDKEKDIRKAALSSLITFRTKGSRNEVLKALKDPSSDLRAAAVDYLVTFDDPDVAPALVSIACDPVPAIRMTALSWLSKKRGEESSRSVSAFIPCGDAGMRMTAVELLADRDDAAALVALTSEVQDADPGVRLKAASALLARGVRAPVAGLWRDESLEIRRLSLLAMASDPKPDMLEAIKVLAADKDQVIRFMTLDVLKEIAGARAGEIISGLASDSDVQVKDRARLLLLDRSDDGAVEGLSLVLYEGSLPDRKRALGALASITGPEADTAICKAFLAGGETRAAALKLLSVRKPSCLVEAVKTASTDPDAGIRSASIDYAGYLASEKRDEVYTVFLSSGYPEVRKAGVSALAGNSKYAAALEKMLDDPVADVRKIALRALLEQKHPLEGRLGSLLIDSDPDISRISLDVVLSLPDSNDKTELLFIAAKGCSRPELRLDAARKLVPYGDPRALTLFKGFFDEGYEPNEMLKGIIEVKGPDALDALSYIYHKGDDGQRLLVVKSLAGRGPEVAKVIREAMDDRSPEVRREALSQSRGLDPQQRLAIAAIGLNDTDVSVKKQALDNLAGIDEALSVGYIVKALNDPELTDAAFAILSGMKSPPVTAALSEEAVSGLKEPAVRANAVELLEEKNAGTGTLIRSLDDPEQMVRQAAADALIKRGGPEAVYGLIIAGTGKDKEITGIASAALGKSGRGELEGGVAMLFEKGMASRERLLFVVSAVSDPEVLKGVVAVTKDEPTLEVLLGTMLQSPSIARVPAMVEGMRVNNEGLRTRLVNAIASVGSPPEVLPLIYEKYPAQRQAIIEAAVRHGRVSEVLLSGMKDNDPAIRRLTASHLKDAAPDIMDEVIAVALADTDESVRMDAVAAATRAGKEDALVKAASDPSMRVLRAAAAGLAGLKSSKAPAVLEKLARDPSTEISTESLGFMVELGGIVPSQLWRGLLEDRSAPKSVRIAALNEIALRKDRESLPLLVSFLSGDSPEIRDAAIKGIPAFGKDALPAIHALLPEKKVRLTALALLKKMADKTSEPPVLTTLPMMDDSEFLAAVEILGAVGGEKSAVVLSGLYSGPSEYRKNGIIKALGHIKAGADSPEVAEAISEALDSGNESVRFQAVRSAGLLKIKSLKRKLQAMAGKEPSDLIRKELEIALDVIGGKD